MPTKKPWLSKTLILNAVVAISAIAFPPAAAWIAANPVILATGLAGVNFLLRLVTHQAIGLED